MGNYIPLVVIFGKKIFGLVFFKDLLSIVFFWGIL